MLTVDADSPITVEHETLTFDYRGLTEYTSFGGTVTASYEMRNPTQDEITVRMAFPYVANPKKVYAGDIGILCDDEYLPWEYYRSENSFLRKDMNRGFMQEQLSIENILAAIDQKTDLYSPKSFDLDAEGVLYQFTNLNEYGISIFMEDQYRAQNIFYNINVHNANDEYRYTSFLNVGATECHIFSLNGPIEYTIAGICQETSTAMTLEEYLEEFRGEFWMSHGYRIQNLRSYWLSELDNTLARPEWYAQGHLYKYDDDFDIYVNLLVYEVTFPANSIRTVSVSYPSFLYINGAYGKNATYQETYLLNPARHWADFSGLDITVYTPEFAPYLTNSSLAFTQAEPYKYTLHMDELPSKDLSFNLSKDAPLLQWANPMSSYTVKYVVGVGVAVICLAIFLPLHIKKDAKMHLAIIQIIDSIFYAP